ncbi:MAG TPA: RnfABCDGE type electron transport complex subunit D [Planctomycetota bacterium]|nr:RnfABCDGE type electron transport complex subunit D [Planctomycetota bacterium]
MLRKIIDFHYSLLKKYPRLEFFRPLIDAGDAFFYGMPDVSLGKPHIRDGMDVKRFMITVLFAVIPAACASIYFYGWRAIIIILTSYIVGGIAEVGFCLVRKEPVTEGFLITGMLYPLIFPPTIPLWMLSVGIVVGVILGKEVFGGTGKNPFNAALVGRCFIYIAFPLFMTGNAFVEPIGNGLILNGYVPHEVGLGGIVSNRGLWEHNVVEGLVEGVCSATPLAELKELEGSVGYMDFVKKSLPSLLWGNRAGCLGETCSILILLGAVFMVFTRVANWRTMGSCIVAGFVTACFLWSGECWMDRVWLGLFHILSGGFLFGAVFMTTDPVTGPLTQAGRYFYGALIGIIAMLIRRFSGYPEGMMFAILLMNIFAALIDEVVVLVRFRGISR